MVSAHPDPVGRHASLILRHLLLLYFVHPNPSKSSSIISNWSGNFARIKISWKLKLSRSFLAHERQRRHTTTRPTSTWVNFFNKKHTMKKRRKIYEFTEERESSERKLKVSFYQSKSFGNIFVSKKCRGVNATFFNSLVLNFLTIHLVVSVCP